MSMLRPLSAAAFIGVACAVATPSIADAAVTYVVREPIAQVLKKTADDFGLCDRHGMSTNALILFIPTDTQSVAVYWEPTTDRFVEYPGSSACTVWKRRR